VLSEIFLLPVVASFLAMIFSYNCMTGEFPFRGLFVAVIGVTSFGAVFAVTLICTILKAFLP
jgi:hypothetical protein